MSASACDFRPLLPGVQTPCNACQLMADLAAVGMCASCLSCPVGVLTSGSCLPGSGLALQLTSAAAAAAGSKVPKQTSDQQQDRRPSGSNSSSSSNSVLVVLQCLQQLLPQLPHQQRQQLLVAVNQLAASTPQQQAAVPTSSAAASISSPVRVACLQLQLQLMLDYLYAAVPDPQQESGIAAWVAAAPKLLWECGSNKPNISKLLLLLLYHAARLSLPGSLIQQQLVESQQQLAPLFATVLPTGSKKQQKATDSSAAAAATPVLVGPLAALPADAQSLACDALCFQPQLQQPLLRAVALSSRLSSYADSAVLRLLDSVLAAAGSSIPPDQYLSFVSTLLSPGPAGGYVDRSTGSRIDGGFSRHQLVVDAVCCWLHTYGPLQEVLPLLLPVLLQQWQQQVAAADGAAAGSSAVGCVRSCSYSCASLAALAVGCWRPAGATGVRISKDSCGHVSNIPEGVLQHLPAVLAAYCLSSVQVAAAGVGEGSAAPQAASSHEAAPVTAAQLTVEAAGLGGSDDVVAEVAAVDSCMSLVMPLLAAAPDVLLMPFQEHFVSCLLQGVLATSSDQAAGSSVAVAAAAAVTTTAGGGVAPARQRPETVAVAVHVLTAVLNQQQFRACLLKHEQQLQQMVDQLRTVGEELQRQTGDAAAAQHVQKLQSAAGLLFGR